MVGSPYLYTTAGSTSPAGSYTIVASQGSLLVTSGNYTLAYANGTLTVTAPTAVAVSASPATITSGQSVTLTATVTALVPASSTPNAGTVTFSANGVSLGTATVSNGVASLVTSAVPLGQDTVTAVYTGDANLFLGGSSTLGPSSLVTTVAGSTNVGDNGSPTGAYPNVPYATVTDAAGDLFIADTGDNRVREIPAATGQIITIAGTGAAGYSGDGAAATAAKLDSPRGLALDSSGNLYIADYSNNRVRKVNLSTGTITTVAGDGSAGFGGDGGAATAAIFGAQRPGFRRRRRPLIVDSGNNRVRIVNAGTRVISTLAGSTDGDGSPATNAPLNDPYGVAADAAGDLFIADTGNNRIREVNNSTGRSAPSPERHSPVTAATADRPPPPSGAPLAWRWMRRRLFHRRPRRQPHPEVNLATGIITTVAGNGTGGFSGDGGPATAANARCPRRPGRGLRGKPLIADYSNNRVREVNHPPA